MNALAVLKQMRTAFLLASLILCLLAGSASADAPSTLRMALLPGESALNVLRRNEPLRAYLEERLRMPVELTVGTDYAATGEALRFGRIDIAYLGPVTYILGRERAEIEAFARPMHDHGATFQALIIVPRSSDINSLADLRDENIAFGDIASTSGHWVPRHMLHAAGLSSGVDYMPQYLGYHDAVALAVSRKMVAAGGISKPIFERLVARGKINVDSVRVLAESPPIPEYTFTFRPGLAAELRGRIKDAFLDIDDPAIMEIFQARRFVPARDDDFRAVREMLRVLRKGDGQ